MPVEGIDLSEQSVQKSINKGNKLYAIANEL